METFTIREAAERCQVSYEALRRRADRGSVQTVRRDGVRRIPRSELKRVGLWPGPKSDAPEVQRLEAELEYARAELRELRLLPRKVEAEQRARELIESTLSQERTEKQSHQLQLAEIDQARIEASSKLEQLSQVGFFARRRLLRELRKV